MCKFNTIQVPYLNSFFCFFFFFFNDTATTEIYTLSLHDALPIFAVQYRDGDRVQGPPRHGPDYEAADIGLDRKSTRLNSSHVEISYAVFCLKKKTTTCVGLRLWPRRWATGRLN